MTQRRFQTLATAFVVCIGAAILLASHPQAKSRTSEAEVDAYINLRQNILNALRDSFKQPHAFIDPDASMNLRTGKFSWPDAIKKHERDLLVNSQYDGQNMQKYSIILNLKQEALPVSASRNSETMEATELLNHYFRPLERLGLANPSSPMAAISGIQYSSGVWIPNDQFATPHNTDSPVWVEGEVFFAPKDGQVVIRVTVGGRFVPKGI
ncbi:MAG: hypothetical protein JNL58_29545 [Planctomyces sp.]|nr:hypothetical protein [Planctomyces sp.]